jgi:hypothetical protein
VGRDDTNPGPGVARVDHLSLPARGELGRIRAGVASATVAAGIALPQAKRALKPRPALRIGAARIGIELLVERDARRLVGALVGLAVEKRTVATGLGDVAEAISLGRAVGGGGAVVADLRFAAPEAECGEHTKQGKDVQTGKPSKHGARSVAKGAPEGYRCLRRVRAVPPNLAGSTAARPRRRWLWLTEAVGRRRSRSFRARAEWRRLR